MSKNHLGVCYHAVREAYAVGRLKVGFVKRTQNIENYLTKIFQARPSIRKLKNGCGGIKYGVYCICAGRNWIYQIC